MKFGKRATLINTRDQSDQPFAIVIYEIKWFFGQDFSILKYI